MATASAPGLPVETGERPGPRGHGPRLRGGGEEFRLGGPGGDAPVGGAADFAVGRGFHPPRRPGEAG